MESVSLILEKTTTSIWSRSFQSAVLESVLLNTYQPHEGERRLSELLKPSHETMVDPCCNACSSMFGAFNLLLSVYNDEHSSCNTLADSKECISRHWVTNIHVAEHCFPADICGGGCKNVPSRTGPLTLRIMLRMLPGLEGSSYSSTLT